MKIAVNATNISSGGGLNHLLNFFENLENNINENDTIFLWGSNDVLNQIKDLSFVKKHTNWFLNSNIIFRSIWVLFFFKYYLKKNKCDVLYNPGGIDLSRFKPLITMSRSMLPFELKSIFRDFDFYLFIKMLVARLIIEINFRYADGIIFISNFALSRNKKFKHKSIVIRHGIEKALFRKKEFHRSLFSKASPIRIIYPSSFFGYKNHKLLLKSIYSLKKNKFVELILVGDLKTANKNLLNRIKSFKKDNVQIRLIHSLNQTELNDLYDYADIGIFASKCENLPNILLEMISKGLPVVSSNYGSNVEVLGTNGFYFKMNNFRDLRDKIELLYNSKKLREKISKKNYVLSNSYDWEKTTIETFNFIKHRKKYV